MTIWQRLAVVACCSSFAVGVAMSSGPTVFLLNSPMSVRFVGCMGPDVPMAINESIASDDVDGARALAFAAFAGGHCGEIEAVVSFRRQLQKIERDGKPVLTVYEAVLIVGGGMEGAVIYVPMEGWIHEPVKA